MPVNTSIYQTQQQVQAPDVGAMAQRAMTLANLGMQNQQAQYNMQGQQAMRQAFQNNVGPDGQINRQGVLSDLASQGYGQKAIELGQSFNAMDKANAERQQAQMSALHAQATASVPVYKYLLGMNDEQASQAYPQMVKQLASQGVNVANLPPTWNRDMIQRGYDVASQYKEQMDNALTAANIKEKNAETGKIYNEIGTSNDKLAQNLKDDLDPNKARGGNLAKSQAVVNASDRLNQIFKQFPDYNIPKAQQTEAVSAFGAILNGGSAPLQSQLEELVPKSAKGDMSALGSWLFNDPMGQNQQKFMALLHDSVERERDLASQQVKTAQIQRLPAHDLFKSKNPELYNSILAGYGLKPENIKNGQYVEDSDNQDDSVGGSKPLASAKKSNDLFQSANAGQKAPSITANDAAALNWLKSADQSDPMAFKVRAKLRSKGLIK